MTAPNTALIFGAGFGTRMGVLTQTCPKPLLKIKNRAMIDYAIDHTDALTIKTFVNIHYLAEQMKTHFASRPDITLIHETPDIFETGGGLKNASRTMQSNPVFTMNSDCLFLNKNPLARLMESWNDATMDALLLLVRRTCAMGYKGAGDFNLDGESRLIQKTTQADFIYSGAQIIKTDGLSDIKETCFSLTEIWQKLIKQNRIFGVIYDGDWLDAGHTDGLKLAQLKFSQGAVL